MNKLTQIFKACPKTFAYVASVLGKQTLKLFDWFSWWIKSRSLKRTINRKTVSQYEVLVSSKFAKERDTKSKFLSMQAVNRKTETQLFSFYQHRKKNDEAEKKRFVILHH